MKIALFSDLHVFAHLSRTQFEDIAINFLIHLLKYCQKNKIKKVYFLGDWFHIKNKLYVPPFIKSIEVLRSFRSAGVEIVFLIGNHDAPQMNSTDHSVMYAFEEFGKVVPLYDWEDIDDTRFHFLSYTDELPEFEMGKGKNVLLGHLDIKNFMMESGMMCREGFDAENFTKFDLVFSGHFHKHQIQNNLIYLGSPYQTRFSERNDDKGFVVLDTENLFNWKFNIYSKAPKFKEVDTNDIFEYEANGEIKINSNTTYNLDNLKGNFIRVKTHKGSQDLSSIKNEILALGAETVDFIFEDDNEEKELNMIEDLTMGSMSELSSAYFDNINESEMFPKGVKALLDAERIEKNDFIEIFKNIEEAHLNGWKPEVDD